MQTEYKKPLPHISEENRPYWDGCKRHELVFQKCSQCRQLRNPPSFICPLCHSMEFTWEKSSGKGTLISFVVFHQAFHPGFAEDVPYNVAVIQLEEGIRMLSNVVGIANSELKCDMPVEVVFEDITEEFTLPKFCAIPRLAADIGLIRE